MTFHVANLVVAFSGQKEGAQISAWRSSYYSVSDVFSNNALNLIINRKSPKNLVRVWRYVNVSIFEKKN